MNSRKFVETVDKATTVMRMIKTFLALNIAIVGMIAFINDYPSLGSGLDDMPDGSSPADGYIVVAKVFGSIFTDFFGIIILMLLMFMAIVFILGIVLCIVYIVHLRKYKKDGDMIFLKRNLLIKSIVNGINTGLLAWIILENQLFEVSAISIWIVFVVVEVLLVLAYIKAKTEVRENIKLYSDDR